MQLKLQACGRDCAALLEEIITHLLTICFFNWIKDLLKGFYLL